MDKFDAEREEYEKKVEKAELKLESLAKKLIASNLEKEE